MTVEHTDLSAQLTSALEPALSFSSQMRTLRQILHTHFGEKSSALWSYLESAQPLKGTPFALGIGFEPPEEVHAWLSSHPYPWQAMLEVLRYPVQTWSRDRKVAHVTVASVLAMGAPVDLAERTAMIEGVYLLLEDPVWRPVSLRYIAEISKSNSPIFWQVPRLSGLNFSSYKTSPLLTLLTNNMSVGAINEAPMQCLNTIRQYWNELGLTYNSSDKSVLPTEVGYMILAEALSWTDKNWEYISGAPRTASATWALVDRLSPPRLNMWRDLLEGDENPHLLLAPYIKSSLQRTPVNANLKEIESALSELEFTLTSF